MFEKLDKFFLETITKIIKFWIKKHKFLQHKYDFALSMIAWEAGFWIIATALPFILHKSAPIAMVAITGFLLAVISSFIFWAFKATKEAKENYDWLWERRKNPIAYEAVKSTNEAMFAEHVKRRQTMLLLDLAFTIYVAFLNPILVPIYLFAITRLYIPYVFDFDEPDKKEKEHKESLTEVAQRAWESVTRDFAPKVQ